MSKECCKAEFKLSNFGLDHPHPTLFVRSQWKWHPIIYIVWRIFAMVFFLTWLVLSGAAGYSLAGHWYTSTSQKVKWFIYVTNWSFLVLNLSAIVEAILALYAYFKRGQSSKDYEPGLFTSMTWYLKTEWVLYNVATPAAFLVSGLYWGVIFEYDGDAPPTVDVITHGVNVLYVIIDLFITAIPIRLYHMIHGLTFAVLYVIFSLIYDAAAGGTNAKELDYIYEALDWEGDTGTAILYAALCALVGVPLIWLLIYGLYHLRLFIYEKVYGKDEAIVVNESTELSESGGKENVGYNSVTSEEP